MLEKKLSNLNHASFQIDVLGINELKGMIASTGKVTGLARVIHGAREIDKMQQGDVLIASMTRPENVVAMKKASAIVTDEGG